MKSDNYLYHTVRYVLFKTLAFPPAERLWVLEPGVLCRRRKKREFTLLWRSAPSLFRALFWLLRPRSEKSDGPKPWI
jgi:hypothetical protein